MPTPRVAKKSTSTQPIIENIDEKRRSAGIDDESLRLSIRRLAVGDCVRLTFLEGAASETLPVRITSIQGYHLRGKLARKPKSPQLAAKWQTSVLRFTYSNIHSIVRLRDSGCE